MTENNTMESINDINLEVEVTDMLHKAKIPANVKGYNYLRTAIMLSVNNAEMVERITKLLYPEVGKRYQATPSRVERAIRHAIEIAWDRGAHTNTYQMRFLTKSAATRLSPLIPSLSPRSPIICGLNQRFKGETVMSKLKPSPIAAAGETVIRNICAQGEIYGAKTDKEKARKLGVPLSTFAYWKNNPSTIGIKVLVLASIAFKCSLAWLVTDHKGEKQ